MIIRREWSMPNKNTFDIKPIRALINKYIPDGAVVIDPFSNKSKLATITNDLNPEFDTDYNLDALEFLGKFSPNSIDVVLYDPPFSLTQASECYKNYGKDKLEISVSNMKYWSSCKHQIANILKQDGICISCGWSSQGIGKKRGFQILEILLVPHGGSRNDTIVTVEQKTCLSLF